MVCASVHGADACHWYLPFAFWMHGSGLASLVHDLHVRMHPSRVTKHPLDGLILGMFRRNARDKSEASWCAPLSMDLMIGVGIFHLSCGYAATD